MKIVITGGLGFIGQHLSQQLIELGHNLLLIDSLSPQIHGELPLLAPLIDADFVRMDIRDIASRFELIEGADVIFHLAAETGTGQSMYQMSHYTNVNCGGTAALLEAVAKCSRRPKQIVLASSRSVYGEGAYVHAETGKYVYPSVRTADQMRSGIWEHMACDGTKLRLIPTPEFAPVMPGSVYAATKAAQELLISAAAPALGMRSVLLRFQNVYGEGQSLRNPYTGIISIFYNRARQGLDIPVYEDGLESRDFVHVNDVVEALVRSLESDVQNGAVINVGSGVATSVSQLADTLLDVSGLAVPVRVTGQFRVGDIRHCFADINSMHKLLGFTPRIGLREGLAKFTNWALTQPAYEDHSSRATEELRTKGLADES